jgi:hypothetical protein
LEQVAVSSGAIDLYSPKFGLDGLGTKGEKVTLKVSVLYGGKELVLFGTYAIGARHAQITSDSISKLGSEVQVLSVVRYRLEDALSDINSGLRRRPDLRLELFAKDNKIGLRLESRELFFAVKQKYTVGGRLYLLLLILGKRVKVEVSDGRIRMFDNSRRELAGIALVGNRLVLKRKFQHP